MYVVGLVFESHLSTLAHNAILDKHTVCGVDTGQLRRT